MADFSSLPMASATAIPNSAAVVRATLYVNAGFVEIGFVLSNGSEMNSAKVKDLVSSEM